jgi:hypothetical protein
MPPPTPAELAAILHAQLKPEAMANYAEWILARTPPEQQAAMQELIDADESAPIDPDPLKAVVSNGDVIDIVDAEDVEIGTAVVNIEDSQVINATYTAA